MNKLNLNAYGVSEMSLSEKVHVFGGNAPAWMHALLDFIYNWITGGGI